ncbi:MAG: extracellular solute-binding protein, partial [Desulfatibacillaceae bacterium]|nr:extracellular solute-binding protein [Desulfatibacillaceae bacterium]
FNYYLENSVSAAYVFGLMYESLLNMNALTLEYEPGLAEQWTISDDKLSFTFKIRQDARWSDGQPITAHDVKWTFDAIMNPANLTGVHKVSLARFQTPEVIDELTIRFNALEVHWKNLLAASGFHILPKHAFKDLDFNRVHFEFPVVSGPYNLSEHREGSSVTMTRRDDWWSRSAPSNKGLVNFDRLVFVFFADRGNAFENFLKRHMDIFPVYTARRWVVETRGERFAKNWIVKQGVKNLNPMGFQGFAMNSRKPPFDDVLVRKAMAHLINRERMNSTLMYDQYQMLNSYFPDLYSPENPCPNPLTPFDKDEARKLLDEAGWQTNPATGMREKDGRRLLFRFLTRSADSDKFLAIFREDLKDVGVEMVIDKKDWAAWMRDMDSFNYEMTWAAWGASLYKDPEGMWASAEADRVSGNNITGFKDKRVDELIEKQKTLFDVDARHEIARKIDQLVFEQYPYALLWNIDFVRLLYWNKFGSPPWVLPKYGMDSSVLTYWWEDEDCAADLKDALKSGMPLPPKPAFVNFFDSFTNDHQVPIQH